MLRRSVTLVVLLVLEITSNRRQIVNAQADDDVFFNDDTYYDHDAVVGNSRPLPLTNDNNNSGGGIQFDDGLPFVVDDACTDAQRRWHGVCTPASRCPSVLDEFKRHGRKPTVCSYGPSELIVCCPTPAPAAATAPTQQQQPQFLGDRLLASERPNRNTDTPTAAASGRISQQKCEEYSRLATHTGSFTLLSIITHVDSVSIPTCAYPTGLIVGGIKTKVGEFPHMAVIGWTEPTGEVNWNCGGSLISDRFVLTAGHCAAVRGVAPDIVRLGEQNLARTDDKASPVDYGVTEVIAHPNYKTSSHYFDIAVVKLDRPVGFNKMIRPACLWQNEDVNSTRAVATGWGRVEFSGGKSDDLLKVPLDIVENGLCSTMYGPSKRLRSGLNGDQLCAGFVNGGKDTCQGDSGGPLQVLTPRNQCIFHIIGVTSFGRACAARNSAGVYTRVSSYLDWLESVVWT